MPRAQKVGHFRMLINSLKWGGLFQTMEIERFGVVAAFDCSIGNILKVLPADVPPGYNFL